MKWSKFCVFVCALMLLGLSGPAFAQSAEPVSTAEIGYVLNTLLVLVSGLLVAFMATGFSMLEAGFVRVRNVAMQLTKNIGLLAIATILYFAVGYGFMFPGGAWIVDGILGAFSTASHQPLDLEGVSVDVTRPALGADFFFQLMFCAATASIVSGAVAERIRLLPFLVFIALLTAVIYPIQASWTWGEGFLHSNFGFVDFAGGTVVHAAGGWAALAGIIVLGARHGKFSETHINPMPASNLTLATLGAFLLWIGWFGFNGGSLYMLHNEGSAANLSRIFINTNLSAMAGALAAMVVSRVMFRSIDLTLVLNGLLGGLVAITANPLNPSMEVALLIGAIAGVLVVQSIAWLEQRGLDDVVGAVSVHLVCGVWGTVAVVFSDDKANLIGQAVGIGVVGAFVFSLSFIAWIVLKYTIALRVTEEDEEVGLDLSELGQEAYPEFGTPREA
ncbi:MAG: ammonium transporter [Pseudomonadota bacterium]